MTEKSQDTEKVYHLVIEHIKKLAESGQVEFGSKIPSERELMSTLGLSRNSVREALRCLENMGIIESRHGQGNFLVNHVGNSLGSVLSILLVTQQSNYIEISQLRRFIEIGAYLLASGQAKEAELERLAYLLEELENCTPEEQAKKDKNFHDELIKISGNNLLGILNDALSDMFERVISEASARAGKAEWEKLRDCHRRVYENLRKKDVQEGIKAIREHYNVLDEEIRNMEEKLP
ncbi:MAG TPA: FadR family transcriptional regulator [Candidatus Blautia stercoravium]|nr:FadR family transcriptional regulator [Candidatus Blautia stercoravium]